MGAFKEKSDSNTICMSRTHSIWQIASISDPDRDRKRRGAEDKFSRNAFRFFKPKTQVYVRTVTEMETGPFFTKHEEQNFDNFKDPIFTKIENLDKLVSSLELEEFLRLEKAANILHTVHRHRLTVL